MGKEEGPPLGGLFFSGGQGLSPCTCCRGVSPSALLCGTSASVGVNSRVAVMSASSAGTSSTSTFGASSRRARAMPAKRAWNSRGAAPSTPRPRGVPLGNPRWRSRPLEPHGRCNAAEPQQTAGDRQACARRSRSRRLALTFPGSLRPGACGRPAPLDGLRPRPPLEQACARLRRSRRLATATASLLVGSFASTRDAPA